MKLRFYLTFDRPCAGLEAPVSPEKADRLNLAHPFLPAAKSAPVLGRQVDGLMTAQGACRKAFLRLTADPAAGAMNW
jgi:hypothetical protein